MRTWSALLLLVACTGGGGGETTTDADTGPAVVTASTAHTGATSAGSTGDTGVVPMLLDDTTLDAGVQCDPSGVTVDFRFDFLGEASHGRVDVADTDNADGPYGNWNDHHTLDPSGVPTGGRHTLLSATVETAVSPVDWADAVSTIFVCAYHFEEPDVMTYAVRAYDVWGNLADCVAFGEDPAGFIAGERTGSGSDYLRYNVRVDEAEFAACRVSVDAR